MNRAIRSTNVLGTSVMMTANPPDMSP